jgi:hypothetical protein
VGPRTDAPSFLFARNFWYCVDAPWRSRLSLPAKEAKGTHGTDPGFRDAAQGDFSLAPGAPAAAAGATAPKD